MEEGAEGEGEVEEAAVGEGLEAGLPQVRGEGVLCWSSWRSFSGSPPGARGL